ncbi:MAG TPA: metallopeptidase TldD-related protein [Thermotogota bacterium]|nr:metallopeptidase TldD-related protein [Thermotogota bacterium]
MIQEIYREKVEEISIQVEQTRVDAIRTKDITRNALRLIDGESIGIAGSLGDLDEAKLKEQAQASLQLHIPYPYAPSKDLQDHRQVDVEMPEEKDWLPEVEGFLQKIAKAVPGFSFSQKISRGRKTVSLQNSLSLDLLSEVSFLEIGLVIKDKKSKNIFDAFYAVEPKKWDPDSMLEEILRLVQAYEKPAQIEPGKWPVVFLGFDQTLQEKFAWELNGLSFGSGASLFSGKRGEKLFSEKLTLFQSRNPLDGFAGSFFDFEGVVNQDLRYPLIQKGILQAPYTDKKRAATYGLPETGSAGGEYDEVPGLKCPHLSFASGEKTMQQLLGGRPAVFAWIAMGGDYTADGHFACPVQTALLFDGKDFQGRLPGLNVSSHLYKMFGEDFIGVSSDDLSSQGPSKMVAMELDVELA